jgi:hypothetical protein
MSVTSAPLPPIGLHDLHGDKFTFCLLKKNKVVPVHAVKAYTWSLVGRPEGRRPLERPRRRWEENIKMNLQEVGWGMDWIELTQDRDRWLAVVNAVMNIRVP